jgi:hypothetical protein
VGVEDDADLGAGDLRQRGQAPHQALPGQLQRLGEQGSEITPGVYDVVAVYDELLGH